MFRRSSVVLVLTLGLVAAGCGDDGATDSAANPAAESQPAEDASRDSSSKDEDEIRKVAAEYSAAFNDKDWRGVCERFSPKAKAQILTGLAAVSGEIKSCEDAMQTVSELGGQQVKAQITSVRITGDQAVAPNATTELDGTKQDTNFERIGGKWYVGADEEGESGEALRKRAKAWPKAWCGVEAGASRAELRAAMGEPTSDFDEQDEWDGFGSSYTAFYDADLRAYQLQVGEGSVPCAKVRKAPGRE